MHDQNKVKDKDPKMMIHAKDTGRMKDYVDGDETNNVKSEDVTHLKDELNANKPALRK